MILNQDGKAKFQLLDVRNFEQVEQTFQAVVSETDRLDILINNAGISGNPASIDQMPPEEWTNLLNIHVNGSFYCLRTAAPYMKKNKFGRIINMSSLAAETSLRGFGHYAAAKYALVGLTESAAKDLAAFGITVNALKPGVIRSALTGGILAMAEDRLAQATPLGKIGSPQDIAAAAAFLCSEEAGFITGSSLVIDGGFRLVNEMDNVMDEMLRGNE
jgi:3-oxoacyl-[acyl-carrier protein] reductase